MHPYSGPQLIKLLEKQHRARSQAGLFKSGLFTMRWRTKVGSFPHPDLETLVSAGEPCGAWKPSGSRPESKRNVGENWEQLRELPLYGYLPAASIRGVVRAWANSRPEIKSRMLELLGQQTDDQITAGKIEFLDAFPEEPVKLSLDIVNPQQSFQVFHEGQSTPLSSYTLGNGQENIKLKIAIRGIPGKATADEVDEVWQWVQQALRLNGIGCRTASGYGVLKAPSSFKPLDKDITKLETGCNRKQFDFTLYSQGNAGPHMRTMELRPTHLRGWLRSWMLRFFLGIMSPENAKFTVSELLGTLEDSPDKGSRKGSVRLQILPSETWSEQSADSPDFYAWKGTLTLIAPEGILQEVLLPIIRVAVTLGGVGRGWRRPLHQFMMETRNSSRPASRGSHLILTHKVKKKDSDERVTRPFQLSTNPDDWTLLYSKWQTSVKKYWPERLAMPKINLKAEIFSPKNCAIYSVPGPYENPIDQDDLRWATKNPVETRGEGMNLIYQPKYKRKIDVGGSAGGGNAYCSWVSIKRLKVADNFEEIVCLFMGDTNLLRSQFLHDLVKIPDAIYLFGIKPSD
jgi:CRISPR-associated protein Cmr6